MVARGAPTSCAARQRSTARRSRRMRRAVSSNATCRQPHACLSQEAEPVRGTTSSAGSCDCPCEGGLRELRGSLMCGCRYLTPSATLQVAYFQLGTHSARHTRAGPQLARLVVVDQHSPRACWREQGSVGVRIGDDDRLQWSALHCDSAARCKDRFERMGRRRAAASRRKLGVLRAPGLCACWRGAAFQSVPTRARSLRRASQSGLGNLV